MKNNFCPIFVDDLRDVAPSNLTTCDERYSAWMVGKTSQVPTGCSAAMLASKCPIFFMRRMVLTANRDMHDPEVYDVAIERIKPVIVTDAVTKAYGCTVDELKVLAKCNEDAYRPDASKTTITSVERSETARRPRKTSRGVVDAKPAPAQQDTALTDAAETGDMSAAINAALGKKQS